MDRSASLCEVSGQTATSGRDRQLARRAVEEALPALPLEEDLRHREVRRPRSTFLRKRSTSRSRSASSGLTATPIRKFGGLAERVAGGVAAVVEVGTTLTRPDRCRSGRRRSRPGRSPRWLRVAGDDEDVLHPDAPRARGGSPVSPMRLASRGVKCGIVSIPSRSAPEGHPEGVHVQVRHRVRVDVDRVHEAAVAERRGRPAMTASVAVPFGGSSCIETTNSPPARRAASARGLAGPALRPRPAAPARSTRARCARCSGREAPSASATARMCSGVEPQQPPTSRAPRFTASRANQAKYSGVGVEGRRNGRRASAARRCWARRRGGRRGTRPSTERTVSRSRGPREQFEPDDVRAERARRRATRSVQEVSSLSSHASPGERHRRHDGEVRDLAHGLERDPDLPERDERLEQEEVDAARVERAACSRKRERTSRSDSGRPARTRASSAPSSRR